VGGVAGRCDVPGGDVVGGGQPLRGGDLGSGGYFLGTVCGGSGGVLFKVGAALERLAEGTCFALGKTFTLTRRPAVETGIVALDGNDAGFVAQLAGLQTQSEHPIAGALQRAVEGRGLRPAAVREVMSTPSEGITGVDDLGPLWVGNARMAVWMCVQVPPEVQAITAGAETVVMLGRGALVLGAVTVADGVRTTATAGLQALRAGGGSAS